MWFLGVSCRGLNLGQVGGSGYFGQEVVTGRTGGMLGTESRSTESSVIWGKKLGLRR